MKWLTNMPLKCMYTRHKNPYYGENWLEKYVIGKPKKSKTYSVKDFENMDIRGIYLIRNK